MYYKHALKLILYTLHAGIKRKHTRNEGGIAKELASALIELEKSAEERNEQREDKRIKFFLDAEEARRKACAEEEERYRQQERKHEERLQFMFLSFMQQMFTQGSSITTPSYGSQPFTTPPYSATTNASLYASQPSVPPFSPPNASPYSSSQTASSYPSPSSASQYTFENQ